MAGSTAINIGNIFTGLFGMGSAQRSQEEAQDFQRKAYYKEIEAKKMQIAAEREAALRNAEIARADADAAREKATFEEQQTRKEAEQFKGTQRAFFGASGVEAGGTPLLVMEETAKEWELEALNIRRRGEIEAERQESFAEGLEKQAEELAKTISHYETILTERSKPRVPEEVEDIIKRRRGIFRLW